MSKACSPVGCCLPLNQFVMVWRGVPRNFATSTLRPLAPGSSHHAFNSLRSFSVSTPMFFFVSRTVALDGYLVKRYFTQATKQSARRRAEDSATG
jgi:hypothetical protein